MFYIIIFLRILVLFHSDSIVFDDFVYVFRAIFPLPDHDSLLIFQNKVSSEEFQSTEGLPDQNTCNLCGMERLLLNPLLDFVVSV